ncbi:hypothetical protein NEUTE1DRAFT_141280 [Neurospora tetrasperma FGSC 2508]|uniref:Uncharacterized protein n=1 Tax=Neurospora tetrasperma (strain FGSC 2508 / ATCC MYA-4615 / P0657) TaxID=510951 RepID=F8MXZ3_NEUT8|nr:uncharacterized protein NEUTE1DRAFT_141280 [Neurospora tetrasperma FGSC 2508]EGO53830.1 hypothetical protein NEUTE1DRAFT_141280 [Neurospora tetrasperma FGSC 2508]
MERHRGRERERGGVGAGIPEGNASDSGVPLGGLVADKKASSETKLSSTSDFALG